MKRTWTAFCALVAIASIWIATHAVAAALSPEQKACIGDGFTPEQRIAACTAIINNGKETGDRLSVAYNNRGAAYVDKGEFDRSIPDFDEAIRLSPNDTDAYYNRAGVFIRKAELERAIKDYDRVIALKPDDFDAYNNRGALYDHLGKHDRAIEDYNRAIKLKPGSAVAFNNRGIAYRNKGAYDAAIADFDQAIKLDPRFAMAWGNRGFVYLKKGSERDLDRAIADSEQALRLDQNLAYATANIKEARDAKAALIARVQKNTGARVALVIGNGVYNNTGPLPNALNDARDIAGELKKFGYRIFGHPGTNFSKGALEAEIEKFKKAAAGAAAAVVWYSGHGLVMAEQTGEIPVEWVIPVDAKINNRKDATTSAIRLGTLSNAVLAAKTLRLVVMDACRDTRFYTGARGFTTHRDKNPGVVVIYSAQPGQIAQDGPENGNSPFAQAFLESVRKAPKQDVRLLFGAVAGRTEELTGVERQRPQVLSDVTSSDVLALSP
jgi:tetratricopeptide (TPR) repeat protein